MIFPNESPVAGPEFAASVRAGGLVFQPEAMQTPKSNDKVEEWLAPKFEARDKVEAPGTMWLAPTFSSEASALSAGGPSSVAPAPAFPLSLSASVAGPSGGGRLGFGGIGSAPVPQGGVLAFGTGAGTSSAAGMGSAIRAPAPGPGFSLSLGSAAGALNFGAAPAATADQAHGVAGLGAGREEFRTGASPSGLAAGWHPSSTSQGCSVVVGDVAQEIQASCRDLSTMLDECCSIVRRRDDMIRDDGSKIDEVEVKLHKFKHYYDWLDSKIKKVLLLLPLPLPCPPPPLVFTITTR